MASNLLMSDYDNSWLVWAHFNRTCLIRPLDSATNTPMGKSKELSIDLKEYIIDLNKSRKSLGSISKQLQVPRSTAPTTVCRHKVHGTLLPVAERTLVRMVKSRRQTTKELVCNELEAAGRQVSVSAVKYVQWWTGNLEFGQMPDGQRAVVKNVLTLNDNEINLILSHLTVRQCDQHLYTTHKFLYHSHGYPLQSTVTNFYICLHCFVVKCLIQMFENLHGLK